MTSDLTRLPAELRQRLMTELEPGERVVWAGQPDWRAQIGGNLVAFLFGLGWTGITGFFFVMIGSAVLGLTPFKLEGAPAPQWLAAMKEKLGLIPGLEQLSQELNHPPLTAKGAVRAEENRQERARVAAWHNK